MDREAAMSAARKAAEEALAEIERALNDSALSPYLVLRVVRRRLRALLAEPDVAKARLRDEDVEWVVNSIAELGVKIGDQFFFLYKGESLVYRKDCDADEGTLLWRHVGKREFGECCHPINDVDPTRYGTVDVRDGREWMPLPLASRPAPSPAPTKAEPDGAGAKPEPPTPEEVAGYPNDPRHFELGLRLQIARAKGELPSDETPDPAWAAWAESLLEDAIAYRDAAGDPNAPQRTAPPAAGDEVREAAEALLAKMRAVYADDRYRGVWALAQSHGGPYTGPTWTAEAEALEAALAARPAVAEGDEVREAAECTGIAASWCPVHGDCRCPRNKDGERIYSSHPKCPLHGPESTHADAEIAALAARPAVAESDEVREAAEIAEAAPELNLNNYDHEEVVRLNDAMIAVTLKLRAALDARGERGRA